MKQIIKNNLLVTKYVLRYGKVFVIMTLFSICVEVFSDYIGMNLNRWIFDNILKSNTERVILFVVFVALISLVCNFIQSGIANYHTQFEEINIVYAMMGDIVDSSFDIEQSRMEDPEFYDKYVRAISETSNRAKSVIATLRGLLYGVCSLVMVLHLAIDVNLLVTLSLLVSSVIGTIVSYFANNVGYEKYMDNAKNDRKYGYIVRLIYQPEYSKSIRVDGQGVNQLIRDHLLENKVGVEGNIKKFYNKMFFFFSVNEISEFVFLRIIPWILCIYYLYHGRITVGGASVLLAAVSILPSVYSTIFNSIISIKKNSLYIDNFREVLEGAKNKRDTQCGMLDELQNGIEISVGDISYTYSKMAKGDYALYKVNLCIKPGEQVAFVGENGAGKTTLAMLIAGLYFSDDGCIRINNIKTDKIKREVLRDKIAVMTQETKLYNFTVAENILMRKPVCEKDYNLVRDALIKVGLYEKVMSSRYQLDSHITKEFDEFGIDFSGGERQKIALARVYASGAECVILDEPTSALDSHSEKQIMELMFEVLQGRTLILISHRLAAVRKVDKIYLFRKGQIVEEGQHQELMEKRQEYYYLYEAQASQYRAKGESNDSITSK